MSERSPEEKDIFDAALASLPGGVRAEVDAIYSNGHLDLSSVDQAQRDALLAGPGLVQRPVQVTRFDQEDTSDREFVAATNNFYLHFTQGIAGEIYRGHAACRRFAILFPELDTHLQELEGDHEFATDRSSEHVAAFAGGLWVDG